MARTDIHRIADIRHDPGVVRQLIVAIARSVASEVTDKTRAADVRAVAPMIDEEPISNYVGLLQRLLIVEAPLRCGHRKAPERRRCRPIIE